MLSASKLEKGRERYHRWYNSRTPERIELDRLNDMLSKRRQSGDTRPCNDPVLRPRLELVPKVKPVDQELMELENKCVILERLWDKGFCRCGCVVLAG